MDMFKIILLFYNLSHFSMVIYIQIKDPKTTSYKQAKFSAKSPRGTSLLEDNLRYTFTNTTRVILKNTTREFCIDINKVRLKNAPHATKL